MLLSCRLRRPDDHANFLNLFTDLWLDPDHSVSELLTHLSPHFRTKHAVQNNPFGHTTGKQGREIILEILIKFFPSWFHLKRHRTARTDIISQGWLQNVTFPGPVSETTWTQTARFSLHQGMTDTSGWILFPLSYELPGSNIFAMQKSLRCW